MKRQATSKPVAPDATDLALLRLLQPDARLTHAAIGRRVGLAPSAVFARIRRLERDGLIRGYETRLDADRLGHGQVAFIAVRADEPAGSLGVAQAFARIPEVLEVHHVAGEDCLLVKVRVADNQHLARLLRERVGRIARVRSTRTTIVLETVKETAVVPLPSPLSAGPTRAPRRSG